MKPWDTAKPKNPENITEIPPLLPPPLPQFVENQKVLENLKT